ncbi:TPA: hypothetical protein DF272_00090 [Candidatus Falkowbacteria bacterium]|nr:hypothetical protein [Candidatus Falkowbacteria bacterium]
MKKTFFVTYHPDKLDSLKTALSGMDVEVTKAFQVKRILICSMDTAMAKQVSALAEVARVDPDLSFCPV